LVHFDKLAKVDRLFTKCMPIAQFYTGSHFAPIIEYSNPSFTDGISSVVSNIRHGSRNVSRDIYTPPVSASFSSATPTGATQMRSFRDSIRRHIIKPLFWGAFFICMEKRERTLLFETEHGF